VKGKKIPSISVVLPAYNAEEYLAEAIESILNQTFSDFEFLIFDDGSTDGTAGILQEYSKQDARIKISHRTHCGLTKLLNKGIEAATGKYIARMDADDVCLPERFQMQFDFLESNPEYFAVGSRVVVVESKGHPIRETFPPLDHEEIESALIDANSPTSICHPTLMARRSALIYVGGYQEEFETAEDRDLYLRLAQHGRLANLNDILLRYRRHLSAVSVECRNLQAERLVKVVNLARKQRGLQEIDYNLREGGQSQTEAEMRRNFVDSAWQNNFSESARLIAWDALKSSPFEMNTWRVFAPRLINPNHAISFRLMMKRLKQKVSSFLS